MKHSLRALLLVGVMSVAIPHLPAQAALSVISAQELVQAQKIFVETQKLVEQAEKTFKEAKRTADSITGNGRYGREVLGEVAKLRKYIENDSIIFSQLPIEGNIDLEDIDFSNPEDIIEVLTEQFNRDVGMKAKQVLVKTQNQAREKAVEEALVDSQRILGGSGDRLNKLASLASEGDSTKTQKEAADLTNRLLIEILNIQTQQLELLARIARAEQILRYDGVRSLENDSTDSETSSGNFDNLPLLGNELETPKCWTKDCDSNPAEDVGL